MDWLKFAFVLLVLTWGFCGWWNYRNLARSLGVAMFRVKCLDVSPHCAAFLVQDDKRRQTVLMRPGETMRFEYVQCMDDALRHEIDAIVENATARPNVPT